MLCDCIVLAGGFGTRLQSVVNDKPKCLADINGKPFLYYLSKYLIPFQFRKVIFSVGYKKEMVIAYIQNNPTEFPYTYAFAEEQEPLGTGGAIHFAMQHVETEDFFVLNGDTLFNVDLNAMLAFQKSKMADCTLALKPMLKADRYGLVTLNHDDCIQAFQEKQEGASGLINGGIYCVFKKSFENIPFPEKFSFEKEYLEKQLNEQHIIGFEQDRYFIDIGIPEDYQKAKEDFKLV
jgi:D-glycero-alpha-D-manno-heptose 1-phosphate guanylyltransferase